MLQGAEVFEVLVFQFEDLDAHFFEDRIAEYKEVSLDVINGFINFDGEVVGTAEIRQVKDIVFVLLRPEDYGVLSDEFVPHSLGAQHAPKRFFIRRRVFPQVAGLFCNGHRIDF